MNIDNHKKYDRENCLIIPILDKKQKNDFLPQEVKKYIEALNKQKIFTGEKDTIHQSFIEIDKKLQLIILIGINDNSNDNDLRQLAGNIAPILQKNKISSFSIDCQTKVNYASFIEGIILAQYQFTECKTSEDKKNLIEQINLISTDQKLLELCKEYQIICQATNWARLIADLPGNKMTPKILAEEAKKMAEDLEIDYDILDEKDMKSLGMNALLAISAGSDEEARLIILKHTHPKATKTISLVGKGLTFDAGGISIKPSRGMQEMKYDMCGGSAVIATIKAAKELNLPINIIAAIPSSENLINGKAVKPGDVVTAYNGKTISIHNTDAEGRLILADTLSYISDKYKPDIIIDVATLTGAVIACLGHHIAAVISPNQLLANQLIEAGDKVHERLWQLPINEDYKKLMKGDDADICNIGPPEAGTITAAAFLSNFVGEKQAWAHIDIAGVAWGMKGASYINPKNASGFGVRLFVQWLKSLS